MWIRTGWTTVQTSPTTQEVLPYEDVIEHKKNFWCPCNPQVEADVSGDEVYWMTIHNSFDEFLDEDQSEPYEGI